tara:strand:- start:174 stop:449 length:276 start_codon:yes stop_codon:yes gene_type:complete
MYPSAQDSLKSFNRKVSFVRASLRNPRHADGSLHLKKLAFTFGSGRQYPDFATGMPSPHVPPTGHAKHCAVGGTVFSLKLVPSTELPGDNE